MKALVIGECLGTTRPLRHPLLLHCADSEIVTVADAEAADDMLKSRSDLHLVAISSTGAQTCDGQRLIANNPGVAFLMVPSGRSNAPCAPAMCHELKHARTHCASDSRRDRLDAIKLGSTPEESRKELATRHQETRLTNRQMQVLALVERGKSNKQIARSLGMAEATVKVHCMAIYRELGVSNRTEAAMLSKTSLRT